jgi:hypothetical protein
LESTLIAVASRHGVILPNFLVSYLRSPSTPSSDPDLG